MRLVLVSGILKMFSGVFGAVAVQFVVEYLLYISVHGDATERTILPQACAYSWEAMP